MSQRRFYGIIIILLGGLFLISALSPEIDAGELIGRYWPLIIIAIGLSNIIGANGFRLSGLIITVVGIIFLLDTMDLAILPFDAWEIIVPLIIIVIGLWLIFPKNRGNVNSKDYIKQAVAFSGAEIACDSTNYKGADLFAAFGGIDLDLRLAQIEEKQPAHIDVFVAFGGIDIIVPKDWKVTITGIPLFGGWGNKTLKKTTETKAELNVNAFVMFGGLDVKYQENY